jgi:hypothetical protein
VFSELEELERCLQQHSVHPPASDDLNDVDSDGEGDAYAPSVTTARPSRRGVEQSSAHHPEAFQYDIHGNLVYAPPTMGHDHPVDRNKNEHSSRPPATSGGGRHEGGVSASVVDEHPPVSAFKATAIHGAPVTYSSMNHQGASKAVTSGSPNMVPTVGPNGEIIPMYLGNVQHGGDHLWDDPV